ncbi:hypothetical protein [Anaeroselena agilis]|uniref:Uncharacterized protein n=1 Tax=Anaeroselena agilis TaxID=3063788 RepID=A0ABU3P3M1_9FIRM|nr:hypothetical protein [Selenomonadales bacterium 4137-cl]
MELTKGEIMGKLARVRTSDVLATFAPRSNPEYHEAQGRYCSALEEVARRCGPTVARELEAAGEAMASVLYDECYAQGLADGLQLSRADLLTLAAG